MRTAAVDPGPAKRVSDGGCLVSSHSLTMRLLIR